MSNIVVCVGPLPESVIHVPFAKVVSITEPEYAAVRIVKNLPADVRAALLGVAPAGRKPAKSRKDKCVRLSLVGATATPIEPQD